MNSSKFSMNAFLIAALFFSALTLLFTVKLLNMKNPFPVNEFHPIEGTKYGIKYSTYEPNGIYEGIESANTQVLEGSFGSEWGAYRINDKLYVNEYTVTDLGIVNCSVAAVDLNTFQKQTLYTDTVLRGVCKSGELVCIGGFTMPSNAPKTNSLTRLYAMTSKELRPEGDSAVVKYLDPADGSVIYSFRDASALSEDFDALYLTKTLSEVRK